MKTRILSAIIMLPLLLVVLFGGPVLQIAGLLIGLMGVREFYQSFQTAGVQPSWSIAVGCILLLYAMNLLIPYQNALQESAWMYLLWVVVVLLASFLYLFRLEERKLEDGLATAVGLLYVCFLSFHVVLTDQVDARYRILIWLIFITAFGTDIFAYFSGYLLGRHKLCPQISPKKTVEGAVGGIVGSVVLSGLFGWFFAPAFLRHCLVLGVLGGAVSQLGDLTASVFKRKLGIKDYGNLIPGHGGILDRFDSVLFTAPMVFYYLTLVMGA